MELKSKIEKADSIFKGRNYDGAKKEYIAIAELAEKEKLNSELTEAYSMIARCELITDKKDEGKKIFAKAEKIAADSEPLGWSRYLGVRGRFEWKDGDNETAKATFIDMYNYCSEGKLHDRAIDAAHMVAIVGTPEEQIEWGKKGIAEAEAGNVTGWLGPLWNNLGATYEDMKKYPESIEAYLKAREYHHKYSGELAALIADWAVGHAYRLNGEYEESEKWLDGLLDKFGGQKATEFIGWVNFEYAEIALAKDDKANALSYFIEAEKNLKAEGMNEWDPDGYKNLVEKIETLQNK